MMKNTAVTVLSVRHLFIIIRNTPTVIRQQLVPGQNKIQAAHI